MAGVRGARFPGQNNIERFCGLSCCCLNRSDNQKYSAAVQMTEPTEEAAESIGTGLIIGAEQAQRDDEPAQSAYLHHSAAYGDEVPSPAH